MPGKPRKHIVTLAGVVAAVQTFAVLLATRAAAEPSPSPSDDSDCNLLTGSAKKYCEKGDKSGGPPDPSNPLDPAASLARGCADAAAWLVGKLSKLVKETATVDFTNEAFLRQYAVVFAASTVLTLILWLLAVAKRAIRGVPLGEALSEAIGFLWLTVLASAFTPSSSIRSSPRPTPSPKPSPPAPVRTMTPSSAPSPKPSSGTRTSAAARSCSSSSRS